MIPRYSHPDVTEVYSDEWTYQAWLRIEVLTLEAQRIQGVTPDEETRDLTQWLDRCHVDAEAAGAIRAVERTETHHDVAAFLKFWRDQRGQDDGKWIHYGLTSSDLVDTAQAMRFRVLHRQIGFAMQNLLSALSVWATNNTPMTGLTHGQAGEPTSMRARALGWVGELEHAIAQVARHSRAMTEMKLSGPMGTFAHNPPAVERMVAQELGLHARGAGATQILPRTTLALWASSAAVLLAACAKVAHDIRLLAMLGEVYFDREKGHVGSSAMPHKNNPIEAEKVAGLARLARGYAAALEPGMLWLERDISNSSVERVAVPDMWHVLFEGVHGLEKVLTMMKLRTAVIEQHIADRSNELWSHKTKLAEIAGGSTYEEATEIATDWDYESYDINGDAKWFMRNYPGAK